MRFPGASRPAAPPDDVEPGDQPAPVAALRAFPLPPAPITPRWRHAVRAIGRQGRLRLHEAVDLDGFDGRTLVARLRPTGWELRATGPATEALAIDDQRRLIVPVGVRHQLGLVGTVVVSLAADCSRIVVWPSSHLDDHLEEHR